MSLVYKKNGISFEILGRLSIDGHSCIVVKNSQINENDGKLVYYQTNSGMNSWRLCVISYNNGNKRYEKGLDYVQSNLIEYGFQLFIETNQIPDYNYTNDNDYAALHDKVRQDLIDHLYDTERCLTNHLTYLMSNEERKNWFSNRIHDTTQIYPLRYYLITIENSKLPEVEKIKNLVSPFPSCGYLKNYDASKAILKQVTNAYKWETHSVHLSNFMKEMFVVDVSRIQSIGKYKTHHSLWHSNPSSIELTTIINQEIFRVPMMFRNRNVFTVEDFPFDEIELTYAIYTMDFNTYPIRGSKNKFNANASNYFIPLALTNGLITKYGTYSYYLTISSYICKVLEYNHQLPKIEAELLKCSRQYSFIGEIQTTLYPSSEVYDIFTRTFTTNANPNETKNVFGYEMELKKNGWISSFVKRMTTVGNSILPEFNTNFLEGGGKRSRIVTTRKKHKKTRSSRIKNKRN